MYQCSVTVQNKTVDNVLRFTIAQIIARCFGNFDRYKGITIYDKHYQSQQVLQIRKLLQFTRVRGVGLNPSWHGSPKKLRLVSFE